MSEKVALRRALSDELCELAGQDPKLTVLTSDSRGSVTLGRFADEHPAQLVECGIAEQNEIGVAAGLALSGRNVFVCAPAPFLSGRAYEQVKLDVAYNRAPVRVMGVSGGVSYGELGTSHHSAGDIAAMRAIDGLTVLVPSDAVQLRALVRWLAENPCPAYVRMGRAPVEVLYDEGTAFEPGRAAVAYGGTPSDQLAILAMGEMVAPAVHAAEALSEQGVAARVLDMFSVKPLDVEAVVEAARTCGRIVTVEEHNVNGGLGGAVAEVLADRCPTPMMRLALPDEPVYEAESPEVFEHYGLTAEGILSHALAFLGKVD
ncbi:MAG: transketolase family protein [Atopobiaceae bacterium]|nr:transketolase family protein [Atopobiaceae bacterium]